MKDILIDNNTALTFANPIEQESKDFIKWLEAEGALVCSNPLLREYHQSMRGNTSLTNILAIIAHLTKEGRFNKKSNKELEQFRLNKTQKKKLLCNPKDIPHFKLLLISYRKIAISTDNNLRRDINNFKKIDGIQPMAYEKIIDCEYQ